MIKSPSVFKIDHLGSEFNTNKLKRTCYMKESLKRPHGANFHKWLQNLNAP